MASNNEKKEHMEAKTVQEAEEPEGSGFATKTQKEEEGSVDVMGLAESKPEEKEVEHVIGDPGDKDKTTTSPKEGKENPEVEVDILHAPEAVPSEQQAPEPADAAPLQTQQKGCCVIL